MLGGMSANAQRLLAAGIFTVTMFLLVRGLTWVFERSPDWILVIAGFGPPIGLVVYGVVHLLRRRRQRTDARHPKPPNYLRNRS